MKRKAELSLRKAVLLKTVQYVTDWKGDGEFPKSCWCVINVIQSHDTFVVSGNFEYLSHQITIVFDIVLTHYFFKMLREYCKLRKCLSIYCKLFNCPLTLSFIIHFLPVYS